MVSEHQGLDLGVSTLHLNFSQAPSLISFSFEKKKKKREREEPATKTDPINTVLTKTQTCVLFEEAGFPSCLLPVG